MATQTITRNARGGIDKLSNREMRGARPQGATGAQGQLEMPAIPATALTPVAPMKLPTAPVPEDPGDVIGSNNVGLATDGSLSLTGNQLAPALPEAPEAPKDNLGSIFNQYMGAQEAPGSTADIYAEEAAKAGLEEKRKTFNNLSARLNSITANRDASILKLEGENMDKGVTKNVFAGQAARINREAAIQALPVQAQLAAAQGNLEMAEAHVDKMFAIKAQDAQAQYQFKGKVLDAVYEFATDQEKRRLDEVKAQEDRKYEEQQDFLKTQRSLLSSALQQGAPSSVVNAINGAATQEEALIAAGQYTGDVLARQIQQKQLADMYAPKAAAKRDTQVVDGKLIDMQTGEVITDVGTANNPNGTLNGKPQNTTQSQIQGYANRLAEADRIFDNIESQFTAATAFGDKLPNFMQSSERQQFEQAKRNFVNAVLRRESGAVIADSEFANAAKQYFAQPGDSDDTLAQKRINRNTVVNNLYREANVPRPVVPGDIIQDEDTGKQYRVEDDGETLTEI